MEGNGICVRLLVVGSPDKESERGAQNRSDGKLRMLFKFSCQCS